MSIQGGLEDGPNMGPSGIISLDSFGDIGGGGKDASTKAFDKSFWTYTSGAGGINKPMSPADVKLAEQRLQTIVDKSYDVTPNTVEINNHFR